MNMGMIRFLERSKKYMTETEENESEATGEKSPIKLNKHGDPDTKLRFNVRRMLAEMEVQRKKN